MKFLCLAGLAASVTLVHCAAVQLERRDCNRNNCYRQILRHATDASGYCATYTTAVSTVTTGLPTFVSDCSASPSKVSSACSCIFPAATVTTSTTSAPTSPPVSSTTAEADSTSIIGTTKASLFSAAETATNTGISSASATAAPTVFARPLRIGPIDGANGAAAVKSGPVKKLLSGKNNGDGTYLLSVIQITGKNGSPLINLEDSLPVIARVACSDNSIGVEFNSEDAYAIAKNDWKAGFGGITSGADFCGNDLARTYFRVTSVTASDASRLVTLQISQASLRDVAARTKIDFGTLAANSVSQSAPEVGAAVSSLWPSIQSAANPPTKRDSGSTLFDLSPDKLVGGQAFGAFPNITDVVDCTNCGVFGTFSMSGGVDIDWSTLSMTAYVGMDIVNLGVNMDFMVAIRGAKSFKKEFKLARVPYYLLPHIVIEGLIDFGPYVDLVGGIRVATTGTFQVSELGFTFPTNTVGWRVGTDGATSYGWDRLTPQPRKTSWDWTEGTIDVTAYVGPKISLVLQVFDPVTIKPLPTLDWTAYVEAQFPEVTASFTRATDASQRCYNPNGNAVDIELSAGAALLAGYTGLGVSGEYTIWNPSWNIFGTCRVY